MPTQTEPPHTVTTHPSNPDPAPSLQTLLDNQARYKSLRYKASLGVLVIAPALILLPPRKMDLFTFGLGASWLYCLGEFADQHGRDPWRGFKRYKQLEREKLESAAAGRTSHKGKVVEVNGELVKVGGWKGEKIVRDVRPREEEGKSISEIIMEQVWDVWEQKDLNREGGKGKGKGKGKGEQ
ncbi:hypothetical protein L873DRAFT_1848071 [Choiromyces venosus 120613-1]|uniref:Uncharacterized protein n=1 Tax=Choiromyces venosus 120613-1 TaxID=1336337 RepID=A0A3N4J3T4_9PEZI|nr:hypothetical protein L873DRAFT_1848071 [Choiromyces venosus 120613-1]